MILLPDDNWCWCFDVDRDRLLLDLSAELQFETAYPAKQLVPAAREAQPFSLDDASRYFHLLECIAELPLSEPERVQIVLNAIAACRFGKPMLPQSWFFRDYDFMHGAPLLGEVVSMISEQGHGDFLVIEPGETASLCLLLSEQLALNEDKHLTQSAVIKVMNNRLIPFQAVSRQLLLRA